MNGYRSYDGRTIQRNAGWKWAVTSEDEWYKAAYYKGGSTNAGYWDYPTSSNDEPGVDLDDASGNNANYFSDPLHPHPIESPYYTTVAGEFQNSDSPYGTFDQGGNLGEWNESVIDADASYAPRGVRGGAYHDIGSVLHASVRYYMYSAYEVDDVGFRVSEIPEPASLGMLVFGAIGMLVRRRGLGG